MASPEITASDRVPGQEHLLDLDEPPAAGRAPKLVVGAAGLAWVTMAVLAVTVLRPDLAGVNRPAERAPAIAGQPASPAPLTGAAGPGGESATPSPSVPSAPGQARPSHVARPAAPARATAPARAAAGTPAGHPGGPQPTASSPGPSGGSAYQGLPGSASSCSQAASASSAGSIIRAVQACASGLASS